TLLEVAGMSTPSHVRGNLDGESLVPLLRNPDAKLQRESLVWHFPYYHPETGFEKAPESIGIDDGYVSRTYPQSAIRVGDEKLIYFHEDNRSEYYNLADDPGEQEDLSQSHPARAAALKERLLTELHRVEARFPERNAPASANE